MGKEAVAPATPSFPTGQARPGRMPIVPATPALSSVASHADLLTLTGHDPYVRWGVPDPLPGLALHTAGTVAVERLGGRRHGFVIWPVPGCPDPVLAVRGMLASLQRDDILGSVGARSLSLPQAYGALLAEHFRVRPGGDWDWMWTVTPPPPVPGEAALVRLDDAADAAEIEEFSRRHSPRGEGAAGTGASQHWLGLRADGGALLAVGAAQRLPSGVPHLAGIVTDRTLRGRGLGAAVTAGLLRWALADCGVCTLGVYSDNDTARRLYHGLGFRTAHAWCSRAVFPRTTPHT